jgi:hypothetical protein
MWHICNIYIFFFPLSVAFKVSFVLYTGCIDFDVLYNFPFVLKYLVARGSIVVKALHYKLEGCGFETP